MERATTDSISCTAATKQPNVRFGGSQGSAAQATGSSSHRTSARTINTFNSQSEALSCCATFRRIGPVPVEPRRFPLPETERQGDDPPRNCGKVTYECSEVTFAIHGGGR